MDSETNEVVKEPFAAVQTLYYGENKYGYSDDVKGRKGKLGPGDTYSDLELETLTLWWGQEKSESGMSLRFEDQFGIIPKNQSCQILNYPFTTMPVTIHSWQLNKDTMSGWLDTLEGAGLNMVYTDSQGQQVKREDPGFRIINMLGAGDAADEDTMLRLMRETALKSTSNGEGRIDVANALVSTGIALATTYNIGTDMDMLTMKIVPTADPTVFRGIFLAGVNNMIDDNVTGIDPDTSQKDDLDYMPGFADLKNIASMGASGWATDAKNRTENAQKLLKNHATTRNRENNISYMLKGGFGTEIYYDYDAGAWKMVVVTGQLNVGSGFGMSWNFNSFCGPVPVTAQLAFGVALDVQFAAAVDRTQMANDYLTQVQLNAFIRAFGGIGFDYAILAMKIGLFGQLSFQGAVRFLNAIGEAQAKVGYKIDFLGEVGIEFLIKFLFITYERVLWSQKIQIPSIQDNNWDAIEKYWEEVQQGNSGNEYEIITPGETQQASLAASQQPELLAADSSTGVALYGAPSIATLESRDYLESPRTYGGSLQVLRARAQTLAENTTSTGYQELIGNSYPNSEPFLTEDGAILAFLHDNDSTQLEDTKASYVQWNGASFGEEDIHAFPDPASTDEGEGEGASAHANQESIQGGDNQLRLAGTNSAAIAAWTRVTETLAKEPGSAVTEDEQLLMMNSSEILASVWDGKEWVTTRLTQNSSADMAPVVAVGGGKALVAWRAVAASDSGAPTEFDSYDTIQYKVYDFKEKNWSSPYTLYNGTSGAVKGMEAQMTESGAMAVAYTIEKGSTSSTTRAVTLPDCGPAGRERQRDCLPADLYPGERHPHRPDSAGRGRRCDSAAHHIQPEGRWRGIPLWGEPDRSQHGPYGDCPVPNPPAHGGWGRGRGHYHLSGDRRRLPDRNHLDGASGVPARHRDSKRQTLRCKRHRQPHLQPAGGHHHLGHCCHLQGQDPHLPRGNHPSLHRRQHRRRWLHPVSHHRAGGRPRHRQRQPQPGFQRPDRDHHRHPRRGLQGGQRHCKAAQRLHCACHRPGQRQVYLHHAQRRRHRGCDLHPRGLALCGRHRG